MRAPIRPLVVVVALLAAAATGAPPEPRYETIARSPDGIGRRYLGREIAHYMSHQGAAWLDRPEREQEEGTERLLAALAFQPGECVADIGAGTGYLTEKIARLVAPSGLVQATDIQPEMLDLLRAKMARLGLTNVVTALGTATNTGLPAAAVDTIVLVDVYHEFDHPFEMTRSMIDALRPGGRLAIVEYRLEDTNVPIKALHKMSVEQIRREMAVHDELTHVTNSAALPWQHLMIFRRGDRKQSKERMP